MTVRARKIAESAAVSHASGADLNHWQAGAPPHGTRVRESSDGHVAEPASPLIGLSIWTLGGLRVARRYASGEIVDVPPSAWRHGRSLALAHYLVTKPGFQASREAIRDALWPHVEPRTASAYLSNTIWNLRKALGVTRDDKNFLDVTEIVVRLNVARHAELAPGHGIWVDILAFESEVKHLKNVQDPEDRLTGTQRALSLYQGDFLPECGEPHWSLPVRERFREIWASALLINARAHMDLRSSDEALHALNRLLTAIPDHEEGAAMALRLLMDQKRHREARVLYEHIRAFYRGTYRQDPPQSLQQILGSLLTSRRTTVPLPRKS